MTTLKSTFIFWKVYTTIEIKLSKTNTKDNKVMVDGYEVKSIMTVCTVP